MIYKIINTRKEIFKSNKISIMILLLFFCLHSITFSQINDSDSSNVVVSDSLLTGRPKIGFAYSEISSYGFTIQGSMLDLFRLSATFFISEGDRFWWNGGAYEFNYALQLQKPLIGNNNNYAYVFTGVGYTNYTIFELANIDYETMLDEDLFNYGIGIGASIKVFKNFSIDFEIGYGLTKLIKEKEKLIFDGSNTKNYNTSSTTGFKYGFGIYRTF